MAETDTNALYKAPNAVAGHPSRNGWRKGNRNAVNIVRQVPGGWITNRRWFRTEWEAIKYQRDLNGPPPVIEPLELRPLPFGPEQCEGVDWVYFIQSERGGPIKIGVATNVKARLDQLQSGNWEKLVVLGTLAGSFKHENMLHRHFAATRLLGEWFADTADLRNAIDALCNPPSPLSQGQRVLPPPGGRR